MNRTILSLIAATFVSAPLAAVANAQVDVRVETGNPEYHQNYHHHHRHYHTVKVVRYRDGVRYVTYRRVYDRDNG
jgi:hypothetical protein